MKIFVIGTSGSGKSTLACELAQKLGFHHIELDGLLWEANWQKRSVEEFNKSLSQELAKNSNAIIDGNFTRKEITPSGHDHIVWLDYDRWFITLRILRRSIKRVTFRTKLWAGNRERLSFLISTNPELNPVLWSFKTHSRRREFYSQLISNLDSTIKVHHFGSQRELTEHKGELIRELRSAST